MFEDVYRESENADTDSKVQFGLVGKENGIEVLDGSREDEILKKISELCDELIKGKLSSISSPKEAMRLFVGNNKGKEC